MPEYLAPGVYVEETSFRAKPIEGVSTSTTGFVGASRRGPTTGTPELITNVGEFERVFGGIADLDFSGEGARDNYLAHAVRGFFDNGGARLYVARAFTPRDAMDAHSGLAVAPPFTLPAADIRWVARQPGSVGNGRISGTERRTRATWVRMDAAPVGSVAIVGNGTLARSAEHIGRVPPFRLTPGMVLRVDTGAAVDINFPATAAVITGAEIVAPPADAVDILGADAQVHVVVNGVFQTQVLTITTGLARPLATIVSELNSQILGATVTLDAGTNELTFTSTVQGTQGTLAITTANPTLGLVVATDMGTGVRNIDQVTVADINARITVDANASGISASIDGSGRLRLATIATGVAATFDLLTPADPGGGAPPSAHIALGLSLSAQTGADAINVTLYTKGANGSWFDAADAVLDHPNGQVEPDDQTTHIVTLTIETRDGDGARMVYEGLGYGSAHPNYIGAVLAENPTRKREQMENLFGIQIRNGITALELRAALVGPGVAGPNPEGTVPHATWDLEEGNDGLPPGNEAYRSGLVQLAEIDGISIIAAPGSSYLSNASNEVLNNARAIRSSVITHVENDTNYRIAVLDAYQKRTVGEVRAQRGEMDSKYAALYHPWLVVADPADSTRTVLAPPSGHVCGIYARNDNDRGVHKAPANEVVRGIVGFETNINHRQQEVLNPDGINCFRAFPGRGSRLWGARLASSDGEWKYVSDRRYFNYLEASIDRGTQWAVFEPNGQALWADVRQAVSSFLYTEWRNGALLGKSPAEAFFVRCDRSTMTQNDLDNGRLICEIGVAVIKPAEFVIFRIGQKTADAPS